MYLFIDQYDYAVFIHGIALLVSCLMSLRLGQVSKEDSVHWNWFALFAFFNGFQIFTELFTPWLGEYQLFIFARVVLAVLSFVFLLEFGLRSTGYGCSNKFISGKYVHVTLVLLSISGFFVSLHYLKVTLRLFLVLPAAVVASRAFYVQKRQASAQTGRYFIALSLLMVVWLGLSVLSVVHAQLDNFKCAFTVLFALVQFVIFKFRAFNTYKRSEIRFWLGPVGLFIVLFSGFVITNWYGNFTDLAFRSTLLRQTTSIAAALDIDSVRALSFDKTDIHKPQFKRIAGHLSQYSTFVKNFRGIYTIAQRDGKFYFGPEDYQKGDPMASVVGAEYLNPAAELRQIFETNRGTTVGPFTDEYGTFVSALSPLIDPTSGKVKIVVGGDVEVSAWKLKLALARLKVIGLTLLIVLFYWFSRMLLVWRNTSEKAVRSIAAIHLETLITVVGGLLLTSVVVFFTFDIDQRIKLQEFNWLTDQYASAVTYGFRDVESSLKTLAKFISHTGAPSEDEFTSFAGALSGFHSGQSWLWLPKTVAQQGEGLPEFKLLYRFPSLSYEKIAELEQTSNEPVSQALNKVSLTGMNSAAMVKTLSNSIATEGKMIFLEPVFFADSYFAGAVAGVVHLGSRLERSLISILGNYAEIEIVNISLPENLLLASYPQQNKEQPCVSNALRESFRSVYPLFSGDLSLAIISHPTPEYIGWERTWNITLPVFLSGMLLTLVISVFVSLLRYRQLGLEKLVDIRTSELRDRENDLSITLNSIGDAVIATDLDLYITMMNRVACKLTGWEFNEHEKTNIDQVFQLIDTKTGKKIECPVKRAIDNGEIVEIDVDATLLAPNGVELQIADSAAPIRDAQGHICGAVLVFHDVTEQYRVRQNLKVSEERFRGLVETMSDIVWETDISGKMISCFGKIETVLGYMPEEIVGKTIFELLDEESSNDCLKAFEQSVSDMVGAQNLEVWAKSKSGEKVCLLRSWIPFFGRFGALMGFRGVDTDVTAKKVAGYELEKTFEELESINTELTRARETAEKMAHQAEQGSIAKSRFLANMSHEIRTPLNGIIGMIELLLGSPLSAEQREYARIVRSSSETLLYLLNDILDFSKIEAGKLDLSMTDFVIADLVKSVVELFAFSANEKKLLVKTQIDSDVWPCVKGDPGRLRQVLANLYGNAIKFTERGDISISVHKEHIKSGRMGLIFKVADTGSGIDNDQKNRLFEVFTQNDDSTTKKHQGTGLGLAISKNLVELMGGSIGVESVLGKGSVFWFKIEFDRGIESEARPIEVLPCVNRSDIVHQFNSNFAVQEFDADEKRPKILIVEDNQVNRQVAESMLAKMGCVSIWAGNGVQALKLMSKNHFDLVLMDCYMPVMDGFDTTARIRNGEAGDENSNVFIVAMTAGAMKGDREKCLNAGMDEYIAKPITPRVLLSILKSLLPHSFEQSEKLLDQNQNEEALIDSSESETINKQIFDAEDLLIRMMGDKNLVEQITRVFITDTPLQVESLAKLIDSDLDAAIITAHNIKGAALNVTAENIRLVAYDIELALKAKNTQAAKEALIKLKEETQEFKQEFLRQGYQL